MTGLVLALVLLALILYRRRPIAPGVPRHWRSSHSTAPRLCRRVHRAVDGAAEIVRRADRGGVPVTSLERAVDDLRVCATTIDRQLVAADQLPGSARHRTLLDLRYRIADIEKASARVVKLTAAAAAPDVETVRASVVDVNRRLDQLEAARAEVRDDMRR